MPTWIITIIQTVLGLVFGPKQSDPTEEAEKAGQAQQSVADAQASLKDVQAAEDARETVREQSAKDTNSIKADDGFRRD